MDLELTPQGKSRHPDSGALGTLEIDGCDQCESGMVMLFSLSFSKFTEA